MVAHRLLLILSIVALSGCAPQSLLVSTLPTPSLNAPTVAPAPPAGVTQAAPPSPSPQSPAPVAGIPREWIPKVAARPWRWIVIHHSASPSGGAVAFDRMHRAKGWDELGYHYVIGNGTDTPDGKIEVGPRWPKQKWGAHAKTADNRYNDYGIGICLVGDFDHDRPTAAQMRSLAKLVAYLMKTYRISPDRVIGHGDTKPTHCPGQHLSVAAVRQMATRILAQSDANSQPHVQTASGALSPDRSSR